MCSGSSEIRTHLGTGIWYILAPEEIGTKMLPLLERINLKCPLYRRLLPHSPPVTIQ